jgi:hypothetical protein
MIRLASIIALAVLAGCETTEDQRGRVNADLDARLTAYNGASIADFIARTGMTPADAYPVSDGKVFVFRTDPVYVTLPATTVTPAVTRSSQCRLLIRAVNRTGAAGADQWIIKGTQRSGACNTLRV